MTRLLRPLALIAALLLGWHLLVVLSGLPPFLLPGPLRVAEALWTHRDTLAHAAMRTGTEILAGFALGAVTGCSLAILMGLRPRLAQAIRPVLLFSQTIPTFALAPILTLWLGYGIAPKIVVTALITFFPIASAFLDGLERTPPAYLDLARTMGGGDWRRMWHIRIPAAFPALGTGLKLAAVYAPIGAVIGEWVGGSEGLGAVMIHANGRMRIDLVFASLFLVTLLAIGFHTLIDRGIARRLARHGA